MAVGLSVQRATQAQRKKQLHKSTKLEVKSEVVVVGVVQKKDHNPKLEKMGMGGAQVRVRVASRARASQFAR